MPYSVFNGKLDAPGKPAPASAPIDNQDDGEEDTPAINVPDNFLAKAAKNPALVKADIAINRIMGGGNETISARTGKAAAAGNPDAQVLAAALNKIDPGHTDRAIANATSSSSFSPFHGQLDAPEKQTGGATGTWEPATPQKGAPTSPPSGNLYPYNQPYKDIYANAGLNQTPTDPSQPLTMTQNVLRQLGLTTRAGISGVTGTAGTIGDAANSLINGVAGTNLKMPSKIIQQLMDKVGLPQPQGFVENAAQVGASMMAGSGDPLMKALQMATAAKVPEGFGAASASAKAQTAKELSDAGLKLPPNMVDAGVGPRALEGIGGTARTNELARYANQEPINNLAKKALNLPADAELTASTLQQQASQLIKDGYEPVKAVGNITTGSSFLQNLADLKNKFVNPDFPAAANDKIKTLVAAYSKKNFDSENAVNAISMLRSEAKDAFRTGDSSLGKVKQGIATALENSIEADLSNKASQNIGIKGVNPAELLANFRATRVALAKNNAVERMLEDPNTGIISAVKAHTLAQQGVPLTGELAIIAKAGSPIFSAATAVPKGGKPPPFNLGDYSKVALGSGVAHIAGPVGTALMAMPIIGSAARHGVLTDTMQRMMISGQAKSPGLFGSAAGIRGMAAAPGQLLPLFSQGQE